MEIFPPLADTGLLDLGELLGRHNAFATIAGRCSASQSPDAREAEPGGGQVEAEGEYSYAE